MHNRDEEDDIFEQDTEEWMEKKRAERIRELKAELADAKTVAKIECLNVLLKWGRKYRMAIRDEGASDGEQDVVVIFNARIRELIEELQQKDGAPSPTPFPTPIKKDAETL